MLKTYKTEGLIIKRRNFGEADKIITIFTKHYGKINFLAKGVRKINSRKAPYLELFNLVRVCVSKGQKWDIIKEVGLIDSLGNFRTDLKKTSVAFYLCQLTDCFTGEEQVNKKIFYLLKNSLQKLGSNNVNLNKLVLDFKVNILKITGFGLPKYINDKSLDKHIEKVLEKRVKYFYVR